MKTEEAVEQLMPIDASWWADEGESSDSHSSIEDGEGPWPPADAFDQLVRPALMDWDSSNISDVGIEPVGLNDAWMQWIPPPTDPVPHAVGASVDPVQHAVGTRVDPVQHAVGASVEVLPKRPRSPEPTALHKYVKTEDIWSQDVRPRTGSTVARGAVKLGLAFLAVSAVAYVVVSRFGRVPGERPSDGWNCEHTGDDTIIMFGGKEEFCAENRDAMFPCAFDCPAGSIGVGRSCRCDGCYRDGRCMHWVSQRPPLDRTQFLAH